MGGEEFAVLDTSSISVVKEESMINGQERTVESWNNQYHPNLLYRVSHCLCSKLLEWTWNLRAKIMNYYYSFYLFTTHLPKRNGELKTGCTSQDDWELNRGYGLSLEKNRNILISVLTEKIGKDIWKQCFFILKWLFFKVFFT